MIKVGAFFLLILLFVYEVTLSSLKVLRLIYFKPKKMNSGFIEIQLSTQSEFHALVAAHFITLTPGTLTVDVLEKNRLLVHCLNLNEADGTRKLVHHKLEPLLQKIWKEKKEKSR